MWGVYRRVLARWADSGLQDLIRFQFVTVCGGGGIGKICKFVMHKKFKEVLFFYFILFSYGHTATENAYWPNEAYSPSWHHHNPGSPGDPWYNQPHTNMVQYVVQYAGQPLGSPSNQLIQTSGIVQHVPYVSLQPWQPMTTEPSDEVVGETLQSKDQDFGSKSIGYLPIVLVCGNFSGFPKFGEWW